MMECATATYINVTLLFVVRNMFNGKETDNNIASITLESFDKIDQFQIEHYTI